MGARGVASGHGAHLVGRAAAEPGAGGQRRRRKRYCLLGGAPGCRVAPVPMAATTCLAAHLAPAAAGPGLLCLRSVQLPPGPACPAEPGVPDSAARTSRRRQAGPAWLWTPLLQGLQAEVFVREEHPYHGTASYFRNVQRQHAPRPVLATPSSTAAGAGGAGAHQQQQQREAGEPGGSGGGSEGWTLVEGGEAAAGAGAPAGQHAALQAEQARQLAAGQPPSEEELSNMVAVTCINLLHANPKKASELMLSSHFQDVRPPRGALASFPAAASLPRTCCWGCLGSPRPRQHAPLTWLAFLGPRMLLSCRPCGMCGAGWVARRPSRCGVQNVGGELLRAVGVTGVRASHLPPCSALRAGQPAVERA